ncbi:MAG: hypothetical protein GY906_29955 [bacterium]|nr:hypothetical protein [bacterium]
MNKTSKHNISTASVAFAAVVLNLTLGIGAASAARTSSADVDKREKNECGGHIEIFEDGDSFACKTKDGKVLTCIKQPRGYYNCYKSRVARRLPQVAPSNDVVAPDRQSPSRFYTRSVRSGATLKSR